MMPSSKIFICMFIITVGTDVFMCQELMEWRRVVTYYQTILVAKCSEYLTFFSEQCRLLQCH